jgi:hypothetical protein
MKTNTKSLTQVKAQIKAAFAGVTLGDGLGLYEANAIDDYQTKESQAEFREKDEKDDWLKLTSEAINDGYSSLTFFDAQGMRFHLPAFMLLDLEKEYKFDLVYPLKEKADYRKEQFDLLNRAQKDAVITYLEYKLTTPEIYASDREEIPLAISDYWSK